MPQFTLDKRLSLLDLLRDYGKTLGLNTMCLLKTWSAVREFHLQNVLKSYKSMDFCHLFKTEDGKSQMRYQWGNITSGLELIRKVEGQSLVLTV